MPTVAITNNTREANTLLPNGVRLVIASIPAKVPESSESSNAQWTGANKLLANNWNVWEGGLDGFVHPDCNSITWLAGVIWRRTNPQTALWKHDDEADNTAWRCVTMDPDGAGGFSGEDFKWNVATVAGRQNKRRLPVMMIKAIAQGGKDAM